MKSEKKAEKKSEKKLKKRSSNSGSESWQTSDEFTYYPHYRQMNLSVSRMADGIQTDIRIHRETGHQTDIYVSRGADCWTVNPRELNQLPQDLSREVRMLLNPSSQPPLESWLGFFGQPDQPREDASLLESRRHSSGTCE